MRRPVAFAAAVLAVLAVLAGLASGSSATAATGTPWADWGDMVGAPGACSGSLQIGSSPLTATYTTDSRGGSVGVVSGASAWLAASTDVGAKYGSSRDQG